MRSGWLRSHTGTTGVQLNRETPFSVKRVPWELKVPPHWFRNDYQFMCAKNQWQKEIILELRVAKCKSVGLLEEHRWPWERTKQVCLLSRQLCAQESAGHS